MKGNLEIFRPFRREVGEAQHSVLLFTNKMQKENGRRERDEHIKPPIA